MCKQNKLKKEVFSVNLVYFRVLLKSDEKFNRILKILFCILLECVQGVFDTN